MVDEEERARIRRQMRSARIALSQGEQRNAARSLARHVCRLPAFRHARSIAIYYPCGGEIDPRPIASLARRLGKRVLLPRLTGGRGAAAMRFGLWESGTPMRNNRFSIPEPITRRSWRAGEIDLVLMPLVAFDADGNRLGMGGGYYDRTFARLRLCGNWRRTRVIGVAHDCQQTTRFLPALWDVRPQRICSDQRCYPASTRFR
jgi:5-formyltetrahydrofolate cyclo-ligase